MRVRMKRVSNTLLIFVTALLGFTAGCVGDDATDAGACPCTAGWVCCDGDDVCVKDAMECPPSCGNGIVESAEICDDGLANTQDYGAAERCNETCDGYAPYCGDNRVHAAEVCDQGINNSDVYGIEGICNPECDGYAPYCGDGELNAAHDEVCDSGSENTTDYSVVMACTVTCDGYARWCGDGVLDSDFGEICDDGASNSDDYQDGIACSLDCSGHAPRCGDGVVDPEGNEFCDDADETATCDLDCTAVECGDGRLNTLAGEICDDANGLSGDGCDSNCTHSACGNGVVAGDEFCDDGNQINDDGCPGDCTDPDQAICGNGILEGNEACDDGNGVIADACPDGEGGTCRPASCGDGLVYPGGGEDCEPGESLDCQSVAGVFQAGSMSCSSECRYDFSTCVDDPDYEIEAMVYVPPGAFWMGCNAEVDDDCQDDENPYHEVYVDGFYIDTTEATAGDYKLCVDSGDCIYEGSTSSSYRTYDYDRDDHAMSFVNWEEARIYCEAQGKRLPTEAEWEKAARGTEGYKYSWGNTPESSCDYAVMDIPFGVGACGLGHAGPVGSKPLGASPYGALDMIGNVWEWTADLYDSEYYSQMPEGGWVNPDGAVYDSTTWANYRVSRGGTFFSDSFGLRASHREAGMYPTGRDADHGFRCAL